MKLKRRSYIFLSFLVFIGACFLFFTHTLNQIKIEEKTHRYLETLSEKTRGDIIFESSELKIFPLPHLSIKNILFIMPDKTRGTLKSLEAYPKLLPLIAGKMKLSKLKINAPDIQVNYVPKEIPLNIFPVSALEPHINNSFKVMKDIFPDILFQISRGKIELLSNDKPVLYLTEINTTVKLPSNKLTFIIDCKSSLWQNARINFWLHPRTYEGSGSIDLSGFNIKDLPDTLFPSLSKYVSILTGDLKLSFITKGLKEISGETSGRITNMIIHPKDHPPLPIRCKAFNGKFAFDKNQVMVQMEKMAMTEPDAILSGRYFADQRTPEVTLQVTGQKVDAASARKTALALVGKYKTTRKIFDYVREGHIPLVTFVGKAPTLKEFKVPGAIRLDGTITNGRVYIPKAHLDLKDTNGSVSVFEGNLIGKNLNARLGNTVGTNGSFSIGLHAKDAPFYLETDVDADLSQLPPVLIRLIKNKAFQNEMKKVENCKGRATGKLILGDKRNAIRPVVDVSDFTLSADYQRTPFNVSLSGNNFVYNQRRIEFKQADGAWGQSRFVKTTAVFDWQDTPKLIWEFDSAQLVSEQIYPWLKSLEQFSASFNPVDSISGSIELDKTVIYGPLFHTGQWSYNTAGKLSELTVTDSMRLPETLNISGNLKATRNDIALSEAVLRSEDTELSGSVALTGALNKFTKGTISLNGTIGPRVLPWLSEKIKLPFAFQETTKVALSDFNVAFDTGIQNAFSGHMQFSDTIYVTEASINGLKTNNQILIKSLTIKDLLSDAAIMYSRAGPAIALNFSGHLDGASLQHIILDNKVFSGTISGDINAQLDLDRLHNSCLEGHLNARNLLFTKQVRFPFNFQTLDVTAEAQTYAVDTRFTYRDEGPHHITGNVYHLPEDIAFELDLDSRGLTVDHMTSYLKEINSGRPPGEPGTLYHWPIKGDIYMQADWVNYKKFQWTDANANLRITPDAINIEVMEGSLCNIQTPGHLVIEPGYMQMDFSPYAEDQKLEQTLPCLSGKEGLIQGKFTLNGEIIAGNLFEGLLDDIKGDFNFITGKGRIYKLSVLSKVFALLNITEIFRGKLPDLAEEGFAFESIKANGTAEGTKIILKNAFIDGASMGIVIKGEIDTGQKELDLTALIAPLKTMDFIIKQTPIVKNLIKGALVSIPVEIKGNMANPTVKTLAPADVDSGLLGVMKNTLKLPVTLIQPLLAPDDKEDEKNEPDNP